MRFLLLITGLIFAASPGFGQAKLQILHRFAGAGSAAVYAPIEATPGVFIGTAGLLYRVTSTGSFSVLSTEPFVGALFPASNGFLYGAVGANGQGTNGIYVSDYAGNAQLLNDSLGNVFPQFFQTNDGGLFGFTSTLVNGLPAEAFFRMTLAGTVTMEQTENIPMFPTGGPIQNSDGNLYGPIIQTEEIGSAEIYQENPPSGVLNDIYTIPGLDQPLLGEYPSGPLIEIVNTLYGVNTYGGINAEGPPQSGYGDVFAINPNGTYQVIYQFGGGASGQNPVGGLILASDGYLYGTTSYRSGAQIYRLKIDGSNESVVGQFASGIVLSSLLQGTDGRIYGALSSTPRGDDAIFSLDIGLPGPLPQVGYFQPTTASVGDTIMIRGDYLQGLTGVSFNGAAGTQFHAVGPYFVYAVVPAGATTGPVTVTTPNGSLSKKEVLTIQ